MTDEQTNMISQLRIDTGQSMMDCKRALSETDWNHDHAIKWLDNYLNSVFILR